MGVDTLRNKVVQRNAVFQAPFASMPTVSIGLAVAGRKLLGPQIECRGLRIVQPFRDSPGFQRSRSQDELLCALRRPKSLQPVFASDFRLSFWHLPGSRLVYRRDRLPFARSSGLCRKQEHYPSVICENSEGVPHGCSRFRTLRIPHES